MEVSQWTNQEVTKNPVRLAIFNWLCKILEVDDLPNISNKGKQHWKMFLVPSTSMVWQKEPVNFGHGMPSSKSDTQLVWHRILNNSKSTTASYIPRSPWNNCSFKDAEPRKTIDDDNEKNANIDGLADSRIISDNFNSNIIKTSGKSRKFSSSTTIYDEGIFRVCFWSLNVTLI